jgi:methyltransferase (TIGR00027 family)
VQAWQNGQVIVEGGPSVTARRVAAHRLSYDRIPWRLGDPAADDALAADVAGDHEVPQGRMHEYLKARTAFFDRFVVGGLDLGVQQVIVGGAGYDGRALRYRTPGVRWFEVDHPSTRRDKLARLRRLRLDTGQVEFVAADFTTDPVPDLLLAAGLDAAVPSLFLLEGVAVYLTPEVLEQLLGQFRDVAARDSRLAISMPVAQRAGSKFRDTVAAMGEPALSAFGPAEAADLLTRCGWRLAASRDPDRRRSAGLLVAKAGPRSPRPAARKRRAEPAQDAPPAPVTLPALLSQALVAFTIETDNEAEQRAPHSTTDYGPGAGGSGPWLTSLAMWENCLRFLDHPVTVAELTRLARTGIDLDGMRRWGYLTVDGSAKAARTGTGRLKHASQDAVLRATVAGQRAREIWAPLPALIEDRWRERYGAAEIGRLRDSLQVIAGQLDPGLPDCLPILGPGLFGRKLDPAPPPPELTREALPLNALLSRALLAFATEFERDWDLSLAVSANVLRVLTAEGIQLRDLPVLTGIAQETISVAMGVLQRMRIADTVTDGRRKVARLTPEGADAQRSYREHLASCEQRWREGLDPAAVRTVQGVLAFLAPSLLAATAPYPDGWRASARRPVILPHYPMVTHRGGYPDGS